MSSAKSFDDVNDILGSFVGSKGPYTLDKMRSLMSFLGNPQNKLRVIHVAGTSGKTSTCYYVADMLQQAGKRVGLTVSPHIDEVNERLQINLQPLPEHEYVQAFNEFNSLVEQTDLKPSYFEFLVAFAYWYFAKVGVDYAVVEVGLGGLLDGTNVIENPNKIAVITDIGLDHTKVLGETVEKIAQQKAGIIGPHNVVFTHEQDAQIMNMIHSQVRTSHAQLHELGEDDYLNSPSHLPKFQARNWALAREIVRFIDTRDNLGLIDDSYIQAARVFVPGRMETVELGNRKLIFDGAHNPQKLESFISSFKDKFPGQKPAVLLALAGHKAEHVNEALKLITSFANHIIFTKFVVEQDEMRSAINPHTLAEASEYLGFANYEVIENIEQAYQRLADRPETYLVVTGSLYLVSATHKLAK